MQYCNQAGLGAAVKDSKLKRSELFVMSMVPTYLMGFNETGKYCKRAHIPPLTVQYCTWLALVYVLPCVHHHNLISRDSGETLLAPTVSSVEASLAQMQLKQLDLVMIHHRAPVNAFPRLVSPMKAFPNTPVVDGKASWGPCVCIYKTVFQIQ